MRAKNIASHTKKEYLQAMSTDVLRDMIRQDCLGGEKDQLELDTIEMILDIISEREPEQIFVDINALWDNFQMDYLPYASICSDMNTNLKEDKNTQHN